MSDYPKWMLALAGISLLPVLASPFYLFGLQPFGTSDSAFIRFALYLLTQLLWLVPLCLFFVCLDLYRRGYERMGVILTALSALIAVGGGFLAFLS